MNATRKAVLAALGIAMIFALGCHRGRVPPPTRVGHGEGPGPNHKFGQMDTRIFEVYIYTPDPTYPNQCLLDWPTGTLWRSEHQTVTWFSDDGYEYTVDFGNSSPFTQSDPTYDVPRSGSKNSGALKSTASGYYSFAVHAGDKSGAICKNATDPDPGYYVK